MYTQYNVLISARDYVFYKRVMNEAWIGDYDTVFVEVSVVSGTYSVQPSVIAVSVR